MRFMYALDVMSRNKDGKFQWSDQIVATLNAMGDLSVDETSTTEDILNAVTRLDDHSKSILMCMKVSFTNEFQEMMKEEDMAMKKESQKLFYGFTAFVVFMTGYFMVTSGTTGLESETLHKFMDFVLQVLKLVTNGNSDS